MSKGPGRIEARITELFRREDAKERSFSVGEIADHAFDLGGVPATRAQRLSATRATHRIFRRLEKLRAQISAADIEADAQVSALGHKKPPERASYWPRWTEYFAARDATPAAIRVRQLKDERDERFGQIVNWRATTMRDGRVLFHHFSFPVRVWAVAIERAGVSWYDVDAITKVGEDWVSLLYRGALIYPKSRKLWCRMLSLARASRAF